MDFLCLDDNVDKEKEIIVPLLFTRMNKKQANTYVKNNATNKLYQISQQIAYLQDQARESLKIAERDIYLHKCACNMVKKPGNIYHFYRKSQGNNHTDYVSMLSPKIANLKAELLRKKEEAIKKQLNKSVTKPKDVEQKKSIFQRPNKGVESRSKKDEVSHMLDEDKSAKTRMSLEEKARIYDKMMNGQLDDDDKGTRYLVDFDKKNAHSLADSRRNQHDDNDDQDDWVDYEDSFGRTKRCLKKDVPPEYRVNEVEPDLMSHDMQRELLRQKWDSEHQEMLDTQETVHYANVQYDENRHHGTGYYQFSKSEETRKQQFDVLENIHQEAVDGRENKLKFAEKRKLLMEKRLQKVKKKRAEQLNLDDNEINALWPTKIEEVKKEAEKPELLVREKQETTKIRDWDKGKKVIEIDEIYTENRRNERDQEFAPPSQLYDEPQRKHNYKDNKSDVEVRPETTSTDVSYNIQPPAKMYPEYISNMTSSESYPPNIAPTCYENAQRFPSRAPRPLITPYGFPPPNCQPPPRAAVPGYPLQPRAQGYLPHPAQGVQGYPPPPSQEAQGYPPPPSQEAQGYLPHHSQEAQGYLPPSQGVQGYLPPSQGVQGYPPPRLGLPGYPPPRLGLPGYPPPRLGVPGYPPPRLGVPRYINSSSLADEMKHNTDVLE